MACAPKNPRAEGKLDPIALRKLDRVLGEVRGEAVQYHTRRSLTLLFPQRQHELVPAPPCQPVPFADVACAGVRQMPQAGVPHLVAVTVVEGFKPIEIHYREGQTALAATNPSQVAGQPLLAGPAVVGTR